VSQEDSKDSQPSSSNAADAASGRFAGFGVAPKKGGMFALDKDVFWFAKQSKDRFRWNMLNPLPLLRQVWLDLSQGNHLNRRVAVMQNLKRQGMQETWHCFVPP
jgi:hypothetical protein